MACSSACFRRGRYRYVTVCRASHRGQRERERERERERVWQEGGQVGWPVSLYVSVRKGMGM